MKRESIPLSLKTVDMLHLPINGDGGFQTLMRRIQQGLSGSVLNIDKDDLDALVRVTSSRRGGGFQRRARHIVVDAVMHQLRSEGFPMRPDREPPTEPARVLLFRQRELPFGWKKAP